MALTRYHSITTAKQLAAAPVRTGHAELAPRAAGPAMDTLLQTLFPNGLPAREEVIRRANAWLDEAECLAKSK